MIFVKLQDRTKSFAVSIIAFFSALPKTEVARTIGRQLLRSGTSVDSKLSGHLSCRSSTDFVSKISIVLQETDETSFWLELLVEVAGSSINSKCRSRFAAECEELLKIFAASRATAKANR